MRAYRNSGIFPFICFLFSSGVIIGGVMWVVEVAERHQAQSYEILTVRGCEYLKLIGNYGYGVAIIEVADQPSTCKYNMIKLSEIKKR